MLDIVCPVCRLPLDRQAKVWSCANRHSFDVAREGYVNLLLAQQKNSPSPGDSADSLQARRAFLDGGHYAPMREAASALIGQIDAHRIVDIGCGEGYYTSAFAGPQREVAGIDIAKPAIQLAARRYRDMGWLVGSGAALPVADRSLDLVTNLFTQLHVGEMRRALQPGGHVLVVTPGAAHLQALRAGLFETVQPHEPDKFVGEFSDGFELVHREELTVPIALDATSLRQLLAMTPYVWKARPERRAALEQAPGLQTQGHFVLLLLQRTV